MAAFSAGQRRALAARGEAEPNGSYPIRNRSDLANALKDLNRPGATAADRAWVDKRAKQMGVSLAKRLKG